MTAVLECMKTFCKAYGIPEIFIQCVETPEMAAWYEKNSFSPNPAASLQSEYGLIAGDYLLSLISTKEREKTVPQYFGGLSDVAKKMIFIPRVATHLNCRHQENPEILERLSHAGIMAKYDVLCCPRCEYIIKKIDDVEATGAEQRTLRGAGRYG